MRFLPILLMTVGGALGAPAQAESPDTAARVERIEQGLRDPVVVRGAPARTMKLSDRMRELHVPGVSIAFINGGAIEWVRAYGVADAASGRPVAPNTLFQVGSVSKPVAAVTVMRLAVQRKLDLDENVNLRLVGWRVPEGPFTAQRPVTARTLLSHTAGMPQDQRFGYAGNQPQPTLLQVLRGVPPATSAAIQVKSVPGSGYGYSSLGYAVLEQYVTDATGQPFDALARELVFAPLGMRDSLYAHSLPAPLAERAASGHELDGSVLSGKWRNHPELAAAGLWSTAADLARFAIAVQRAVQKRDASFLSAADVDTMLTPVRNDYGLGFELDHAGREPAFHHSGSNIGFKALMFAYSHTGQGVVILTNGDYGSTLIAELMRSIAAEYGWEDHRPIERVAVPPDPALFDRFAGNYSVSNTTVQISRHKDRLFVSGPPVGPAPAELIPAGDYEYFLREKKITVRFDSNGADPVNTLTFIDGKPRPGQRIPSAAPVTGQR
ncbi:MAG TPA: serine hydrolase domain-containing protein [Telluria sp.]|nr:serine hydrolase domain-containing protein [Telluria sp.]